MSNIVLSGLTTITTISFFDGWDNLSDILEDIKKIGCWFHHSLPENKLLKTAIYAFGSIVLLRSLPIVLRRTEFFAYYERQIYYFHRSNTIKQIIEFKEELLNELKEEDHGLPLFKNDKLVILELNIGSGTNVSYYPNGCDLIGTDFLESSKEQLEHNFILEKNMTLRQFIEARPEELYSVPDNSVSCVVSFHSLCSARKAERALDEIKRVLMPGGKLYFIEHTNETQRFTMMWLVQLNFRPSMFLVHCCLKKIEDYIEDANFSKVFYRRCNVDLGRIIGPLHSLSPHVHGYAIK